MNDKLIEFYKETDEKKRKILVEDILNDYEEYLPVILDNIKNRVELRNNAYLLNVLSKKKRVCEFLKKRFSEQHFQILISDSDPKTRKNTYIFMGNYLDSSYLLDLIKALKNEETNYCVSSLILALGNYKIKNIDEIMNQYLKLLDSKLSLKKIEQVHYDEIVNSINKVINKNERLRMHTFVGLKKKETFFLTCMLPLINSSFNKIKEKFKDAKKYKNGVLVKSDNLDEIFKLRVFYEALIAYNNYSDLSFEEVKKNIKEFLMSDFLYDTHLEKNGFTYRIEFVSTKNKEEKMKFYEEINGFVRKNFSQKYVNNPSKYEFEIRIIDGGNGTFDIFYKLYTYQDNRYFYRKRELPASINPTSAGMMLEEVKEYLHKDSQVLDPFCGTGTILIERSYFSSCKLYGIDISTQAIEDAKINSKAASVKVNLRLDNCLNATGYYDEIISNMPYGNRVGTHLDNEKLYKDFINKLPGLLNENGVAILLTSEIVLMKSLLKNKKSLKLIKDIYTETGGLTPHLFVIKKV